MNYLLKKTIPFILISFLFYVVALWISVFPHEFAHSITAWLFGFKQDPFGIYYGHLNWQNVIFVTGIDENVDYTAIKQVGRLDVIGWAALAGPLVTLLFYLISLLLLKNKNLKNSYLYYFIFWINLINLSELTSYIILRCFSSHGDMTHIETGFGISPWYIFIIGGTLIIIAITYFFTHTLKKLYSVMQLNSTPLEAFVLMCASFFIFGHGGIRMLLDYYGTFSLVLGVIFFILMPIIIFIFWPTKLRHPN